MAFDGITIHALIKEFNNTLSGGRINKIAQPEKDELLLTIKTSQGQFRLILSANAGLPLAYITDNKVSFDFLNAIIHSFILFICNKASIISSISSHLFSITK